MATIRTNGVETYYERRGSGPAVVFVHGAIVDARQWAPQLDALSDEYTTVAYDVRGHGRTGGSPRNSYSIDLFADDLAALVDGLGLDRPVVCGLSMGGCIAQAYATRYPEALSGLVLADTFTPEVLSRGDWLQRSVALRATVPPVRLLGYERVERAMVWLQERFQRGVSGDYENVRRLRDEGPTMTADEFAKVVRAVASFDEAVVDLRAITVPTLVLYGENETATVRQHAERLGEELPDVRVRVVPEAGHVSNLDAPDFFTDALRAFLAGDVRSNDHPNENEEGQRDETDGEAVEGETATGAGGDE
ncbi:alpha/beta fold hydrolase [Halomarina salina]|uniref:Alpha/beta fold hydrolase n=1 Tax=Halomarina salina TaxID=1872699 RepID=A0ABD5RIJ0_9EURY|nr:alpha/beta fold hydrolase [Halomarina salina]